MFDLRQAVSAKEWLTIDDDVRRAEDTGFQGGITFFLQSRLDFQTLQGGSQIIAVNADFDGMTLRKSVTISDRRLQNLYFYWPQEASGTEKRRP